MGSAAKARAARAADAASVESRRHDVGMMPTHVSPAKPSALAVLHKSVRGVVAAFVASARPLGLAGAVMGLVWLALKIVDRFQLWMTAAGVLMVVMSVASAFQEVAKPSTATIEYLDEDVEGCKMITIPSTTDLKQEVAVTMNTTVAVSAPVKTTVGAKQITNDVVPSTKPVRRNSGTIELGDNKLTVVHCGTVIDIQGSRGFIIPHNLGANKPTNNSSRTFSRRAASAKTSISAQLPDLKLPFVIAFELSAVLAVLRHEIMVGQTVEFNFPGDAHSPESVLAINVKPVAADDEIAKSRNALQTCKQAREVSFARAMGELKMISPRHEPIKHHVDLIKYAEHLDDTDLPLDEEFI